MNLIQAQVSAGRPPVVSLWDYLAVCPSFNDAWDAAVSDMVALGVPGTLRIPPGTYQMTRTAKVPTTIPFEVVCDGLGYSTRFEASGSAGDYADGAMFGPESISELSGLHWRGGLFNGSGIAGYAMRFPKFTHGVIDQPEVIGTTMWAIALNGYSNTIIIPKIYSNTGGGLYLSGTDVIAGLGNSNSNIIGGTIYANGGFGARLSDGWGINVCGLGVEGNSAGGILASNVDGLHISGSYFERNGSAGHTLTQGASEAITVKADIFLLGASIDLFFVDKNKGCRGVVIEGCSFTPYGSYDVPAAGLSQHCHVFGVSLDNVRISNNRTRGVEDKVLAMVGIYNNGFRGSCTGLVLEQNDRNDIATIGTGLAQFAYSTAHLISNRMLLVRANYANQNLLGDWYASAGTAGYLRNTGAKLLNHDMWALGPGDFLWTNSFAIPDNLKGKYVWFGLAYRVLDAGSGLYLGVSTGANSSNHDGSITENATATGKVVFTSVLHKINAADTSITLHMKRVGAGSNPLYFTCPMLAEIGADMPSVLALTPSRPNYTANAAPATGSWNAGDRVVRNPPFPGLPRAWICTATGGPGTWATEGNL